MAVRNTPYHVNFNGGFSGHNNPGAQVWYVAPSGYTAVGGIGPSDSNSGTSPQQPFSTIQKGIDSCVDGRGDIVALLPGTYTITTALTFANGTDDNITLMAAHPPVGKQYSVEITTATDSISMVEVDANFVTIQGIHFDHNTTTANIQLIDVADGSNVVGFCLRDCLIDMEGSATNTDAVRLGDGTQTVLNSLIENVVIHDYDQDGIVIGAGSDENTIRNCHIYDGVTANAGQYGINCAGDSCLVENVVIQNNGTAGVHVNGTLNMVVDSRIWAREANAICILMAASATVSTNGNWLTAVAAGNLVDYTTDNTSPSANVDAKGIFAATPGLAAFDTPTVGGL